MTSNNSKNHNIKEHFPKNWLNILILIVFFLIIVVELFLLREEYISIFKQLLNQFSGEAAWESILFILCLVLAGMLLVFLWESTPIKKTFGEGKGIKRSYWHSILNLILILLFLLPFELFFLKGSFYPDSNEYLPGLSIIGVSIALTSICIASTKVPEINPFNRQEFVCSAQKFIVTTIFVTVAIISVFIIDNGMNGINVYSFDFSDVNNYYRGFLFWLAIFCFHLSFILFIVGLSDLMFAFNHLDTRAVKYR